MGRRDDRKKEAREADLKNHGKAALSPLSPLCIYLGRKEFTTPSNLVYSMNIAQGGQWRRRGHPPYKVIPQLAGAQARGHQPAALVRRPAVAFTGPEPARRAQASRRASTRKPLLAGASPRADRFVTLLPNRDSSADQSQSPESPFGNSALRQFGPSASRLLGIFRSWAPSGLPQTREAYIDWVSFPEWPFFSHFRVFRRPGSPRIPEAWVPAIRLGKAQLYGEGLRKGSAAPGRSADPAAPSKYEAGS
ncbi:uncharacterized protein LOC118577834 [Onychomys torridus]|uniref:uncharacterized protein LOC118577834 n=1 Tax=Onychomys torridus TaxID=38674 RepID=UPI00167F91C7|nr:uncharacterized protein LOC118577834 [Onychomys torridus]